MNDKRSCCYYNNITCVCGKDSIYINSTCYQSFKNNVNEDTLMIFDKNDLKLIDDNYECSKFNYPCSQICKSTGLIGYTCSCYSNFILQDDKRSCCNTYRDYCYCAFPSVYSNLNKKCIMNPCDNYNGGCAHICELMNSIIKCSCKKGYEISDDKKSCCLNNICECGEGYIYDILTRRCKINICVDTDADINQIFKKCLADEEDCLCPYNRNLYLDMYMKKYCKIDKECFNCDCKNIITKFSMLCPLYKPCTINQCSQICFEFQKKIYCQCKIGYFLHSDKSSCCKDFTNGIYDNCECNSTSILIKGNKCLNDLCSIENGGCVYKCIKSTKGKICLCPSNFVLGTDEKSCFYNRCIIDGHSCSQICIPLNDKFVCSCKNNYILGKDQRICCLKNNIKSCVCPNNFYICYDNTMCCFDFCKLNNGGCSDFCKMDIKGNINCSCRKGAIMKEDLKTCKCENKECMPICSKINIESCVCQDTFIVSSNKSCYKDMCSVEYLKCADKCINDFGRIKCTCNDIKQIQINERICTNDLCNEIKCTYSCQVYDGIPKCLCPLEKILANDQITCIDNPCFSKNCSHNCSFIDDIPKCYCLPNFILGSDGKTCFSNKCLQKVCNQSCEINYFDGSTNCACLENYVSIESGKYCVKDECNKTCEHICKYDNVSNRFKCACYNNTFILGNDGIHCYFNSCSINNGGCAEECKFNAKDGSSMCGCRNILQPQALNFMACCDSQGKNCKCNNEFAILNNEKTWCTSNICKFRDDEDKCGHNCVVDVKLGVSVCKCESSFLLANDNKSCFKDNCKINNGGCQKTCEIDKYTGVIKCLCEDGFILMEDGKNCIENPCTKIKYKICAHICIPYKSSYICGCNDGYILDPDNSTCCNIETGLCDCNDITYLSTDKHHCWFSACSVNLGNCSTRCNIYMDSGLVECSCRTNYILDPTNGKKCILDPCFSTNGGCEHECYVGMFQNKLCRCNSGFILREDKLSCATDYCYKYNGGCSQICKTINNQAECSCNTSWQVSKDDPKKCCTPSSNGLTCECNTDLYVLSKDKTKCFENTCKMITNGGCQHNCSIDLENGTKTCTCRNGFTLSEDGYSCLCKVGYIGYNCDIDKDECAEKEDDCDRMRSNCINTRGSYKCICKAGYKIDGTGCKDIDECAKISCSSNSLCFNYEGGYQGCTCREEYFIHWQDKCLKGYKY
ncbi:unnamed protein product [Gordionus sp. m RMFG-2023]